MSGAAAAEEDENGRNVGAGRTDDADEKRGEIPILALGALRSVARSRSADLI